MVSGVKVVEQGRRRNGRRRSAFAYYELGRQQPPGGVAQVQATCGADVLWTGLKRNERMRNAATYSSVSEKKEETFLTHGRLQTTSGRYSEPIMNALRHMFLPELMIFLHVISSMRKCKVF
ncbi:hypothetical protein ATANTOWER_025887 [Ataeniobius toweri]|uniref:Uncharacterized protein n=1 Tax=Ataeniobius toweri TaxID=208326 RepID=A0ABU7B1I7_9TELE|nr:hypothetical protein [Ataeniobius toweri]